MPRFRGECLPPGGRIALISNDALGNFVVVTPLLQMLRAQYRPAELDYYGGARTWELQKASTLFNCSFPLHGSSQSQREEWAKKRRGYDLIVNVERTDLAKEFAGAIAGDNSLVCGPFVDSSGCEAPFEEDDRSRLWEDQEWTSAKLTDRHPFLDSGFIGEIFCRLAYLKGPIPSYCVPSESVDVDIPDVIIATAASLPEKLWPAEKWSAVLKALTGRGLMVGLVGAAPADQRKYWKGDETEEFLLAGESLVDLRGRFTLPQVVGALSKARVVLSIDNGILHLAVAAGARTVGLYRNGIHRLWAPPSDRLTVLVPGEGSDVASISVDSVLESVLSAL